MILSATLEMEGEELNQGQAIFSRSGVYRWGTQDLRSAERIDEENNSSTAPTCGRSVQTIGLLMSNRSIVGSFA